MMKGREPRRRRSAGRLLCSALLAAALLCTLLPAAVFGAVGDPLKLYVESSRVAEDGLKIYVNTSISRSEAELSADNFQVVLGNTQLPCTGVQYFSDTGEPVTYVFLVDVSGSISSEKLEQMKSYLKLVTAGMGQGDRACLITLGNELAVGEFTSGQEAINAQIDGIQRLRDDTNLYYGIVKALEILAADSQTQGKKALLVISDGEDDQASGITREEVNSALERYTYPVYTVAMLGSNSSESQQEFAKILGSFARLSAGGIHTAIGVDNISPEDSAARMTASLRDSLVLTADASGYTPGDGQAYLQVEGTVEGYGTASDSAAFQEKDLGLSPGETETEDQEPEEPSGAQEAADGENSDEDGEDTEEEPKKEDQEPKESPEEEQEGISPWVWAAAGGGVLVMIVLAAAAARGKKKRRQAEEARRQEERRREEARRQEEEATVLGEPSPAEDYPSTGSLKEQPEAQEAAEALDSPQEQGEEGQAEASGQEGEGSADQEADRQETAFGPEEAEAVVYLTKIGMSEEKSYRIALRGETTLGREPERAAYAFPEDLHMSAVHCSLSYFDNRIIICDKGSRNGTKVNGVPITAPYPLSCDDIIQIGNSEFRIHW